MSRQKTENRSDEYRKGYAAGFAAGQRSQGKPKAIKPKKLEDVSKLRFVKDAYWVGISYDGYADGHPVIDAWKCSNCGRVMECEESDLDKFCGDCGCYMSVSEVTE